jgi:hypothetical protein
MPTSRTTPHGLLAFHLIPMETIVSKRKIAQNSLPGSSITVGLDIGYGVTKAVTTDQIVTFPSVMGHARELKFAQDDIAERHPGDQITDDEGAWFVGDLALAHLPLGEMLRLRGRTANEATMGNAFRLRLAKVAIGKLVAGMCNRDIVHICLASGLPVDHMRDASEMKAALLGQHIIRTDHADFIANVTEVMVMPQPLGTVYANMLTPTGEINVYHTFMRTGVCDVGTYTMDVALDDDGQFVDAESGSVESGVYTAQERIADMLERDYRKKIIQLRGPGIEIDNTGHLKDTETIADYLARCPEAAATMALRPEENSERQRRCSSPLPPPPASAPTAPAWQPG